MIKEGVASPLQLALTFNGGMIMATTKFCENCGKPFWSDDEDEFYCSEMCENQADGEDEEA